MIELLYVSLVGLSSTFAKYDYCYDAVMAAKYDVSKPDFTEYGLILIRLSSGQYNSLKTEAA